MAKLRKNYPDNLKWNVKDLYATKADYEKSFKKLENSLKEYSKFQGHILDSAQNLSELLIFDREFNRELEQIYIYAHIQNDQDTTATEYQEMYGKAYKLYEKAVTASSFIVL